MLPFEHSENAEDQKEALARANATVNQFKGDEGNEKYTQSILSYAIQHQDIISKFGRFPHRNGVMERTSTDDEIEYLKSANTFGQ